MTGRANSWRDLIEVHAAAEMFPLMSDGELERLGKDIDENGLRHPRSLDTDPTRGLKIAGKPKNLFLVDGQNRLEAVLDSYRVAYRAPKLACAGKPAGDCRHRDSEIRCGDERYGRPEL